MEYCGIGRSHVSTTCPKNVVGGKQGHSPCKNVVGGKQGHSPCKMLSLHKASFLCQSNLMEIM